MNWLLLFVPITVVLEHAVPERPLLVFASAALSIIPLAGWMAHATENLAQKTGEGIGGLLNATFGNAAELIIAFAALRAGLIDVVKASLIGAIIGNMLLVLGDSMLFGGIGRTEQKYNAAAGRSQATMLTLAAIALILPAAFQNLTGAAGASSIGPLSVGISILLLAVYGADLIFTLVTHRSLFSGSGHQEEAAAPKVGAGKSMAILAAATVALAWMSEILVGAVEPVGTSLSLNSVFMGLFVLATLGSAAEHFAAVRAARKDRMDLAISISIGSSVQIALFVAPLLVLLSYVVGPAPMDLVFGRGLLLGVIVAVWVTGQVAADGRSDWLRGVQLLAVYLILATVVFFAPTP